jgi:hypothetical protein
MTLDEKMNEGRRKEQKLSATSNRQCSHLQLPSSIKDATQTLVKLLSDGVQ